MNGEAKCCKFMFVRLVAVYVSFLPLPMYLLS